MRAGFELQENHFLLDRSACASTFIITIGLGPLGAFVHRSREGYYDFGRAASAVAAALTKKVFVLTAVAKLLGQGQGLQQFFPSRTIWANPSTTSVSFRRARNQTLEM